MALVVITDPLATEPAANSYVSVADADEYVSDRITSATVQAAWTALTADQKATAVVNASRALDQAASWIGDRYWRDQGLGWPRVNAMYDGFYLESTTFPIRVVEATVEMALWSMTNSGAISVQQNASFDAIKVGPLTIDFNEGAGLPAVQYFPEIVAYLLSGLADLNDPQMPNSSQARNVRLIRA
jgi:hypothetical protein